MPRRPYPRWQRRHEAVLLWCLQNPGGKLKGCAREVSYSRTHVSRIINSPDFRKRYNAALEAGRLDAYRRMFRQRF